MLTKFPSLQSQSNGFGAWPHITHIPSRAALLWLDVVPTIQIVTMKHKDWALCDSNRDKSSKSPGMLNPLVLSPFTPLLPSFSLS